MTHSRRQAPARGQSTYSYFRLLRHRQCIVYLDAEVTDGALELRVPKQKLSRAKVLCSTAGGRSPQGHFMRKLSEAGWPGLRRVIRSALGRYGNSAFRKKCLNWELLDAYFSRRFRNQHYGDLRTLARLDDGRLSHIQTPPAWLTDRRCMPYCFRCLVLNDADVSAPRWESEWLDPTAGASACVRARPAAR